jgi:hypothetical protein
LVMGKSPAPTPVNIVSQDDFDAQNNGEPQKPEVEPPHTPPEIQPPQPDQIPPPPNEPQPDPANQPLSEKPEGGLNPEHQINDSIPQTPEQIQRVAQAQAQAVQAAKVQADNKGIELDPQVIAQVVEQVTPQITKQVVQQMTEQGIIATDNANNNEKNVDNDLIHVFDEAALDKDGKPNDNRDRLEYAIH